MASEPYGLVEETAAYLRMDGEATQRPGRPCSTGPAPGPSTASTRSATTAVPCRSSRTTWSAPRSPPGTSTGGGFPHFLLKEITEAPGSFRKTLRGRIVERDGRAHGRARARRRCPRPAGRAWRAGAIRRVAGHRPGHRRGGRAGVAAALAALPGPEAAGRWRRPRHRAVRVRARPTTCPTPWWSPSASPAPPPTPTAPSTWSGPGGPASSAVVNRRNSDLAAKAARGALHLRRAGRGDERGVDQGVLRPGRGRLAAGRAPLADAARPTVAPAEPTELLRRPARAARRHGRACSPGRPAIAARRPRLAPPRALLGGRRQRTRPGRRPRRCGSSCPSCATRSIACDATEDKKHIDLSSRAADPGVRRRARGPNADDVAKEVAIYRAPQGRAGRHRGRGRGGAVRRPARPRDRRARGRPRRRVRAVGDGRAPVRLRGGAGDRRPGPPAARRPGPAIEDAALGRRRRDPDAAVGRLSVPTLVARRPAPFVDGLGSGSYNGNLEASHRGAAGLAAALRHGAAPARGLRGRDGQDRHARRRSCRTCLAALSDGIDAAHPARSTPSSTRPRR